MILVGVSTEFVFGFVLGRPPPAKRGGLGGRSPPSKENYFKNTYKISIKVHVKFERPKPKRSQDRAKTAQNGAKMAQNGAKMAQNSTKLEAKTEPRRPKTVLRSKVAFRTALGELHRSF